MYRRSLLALLIVWLFAGCFGKTLEKDGGVVLVYELADKDQSETATVVTAIRQRLDQLVPRGQLGVKEVGKRQFEVTLVAVSDEEIETAKRALRANGDLEFRIVALRGKDDKLIAAVEEEKPPADKTQPFGKWVGFDPERCPVPDESVTRNNKGKQEILVIDDELDLTGEKLKSARSELTQRGWEVTAELNPEGAAEMQQLTNRHLPVGESYRQLGIILDGELLTAPRIVDEIHESLAITGEFSEADVRFIAHVLKAGRLPANLKSEPISEKRVPAKQ